MPEAARLIERGTTTLQRLETGQANRIRLLDIRELCSIYGASDVVTAGLLGLAQQASGPNWWHADEDLIPQDFNVYVGLETAARRLTSYAPDIVLGLLQVPDYCRALLRLWLPMASRAEIDRRVEFKQRRQRILTRKHQPTELHAVLLECALRRVVGDRKVMAGQLRKLADISARPNVTLQVLPLSAGIPLGNPAGLFTILDFGSDKKGQPVEPPVIYLENLTGAMYLPQATDVERYAEVHRAIRRGALDETASRSLFRQLAREFDS